MFKPKAFSKELPKRFKMINCFILLPILLWPLIFFGTIFFFDDPNRITIGIILFFLVNSYPLFLFILYELNARIYLKWKGIGYLIPLVIVGALIYCGWSEHQSSKRFIEQQKMRKEKNIELKPIQKLK